MIRILVLVSLSLVSFQISGQEVQTQSKKQVEFNDHINKWLSFSAPFITVGELDKNYEEYLILDSREQEEYDVAHLDGAKCVGYDDFDMSTLDDIDKDQKIAVYCSIGYRSEKITEKLRKAGFKNAFNVYGSIFQWVNENKPVYNKAGEQVDKVHTFNRKWSKWVLTDEVKKVW